MGRDYRWWARLGLSGVRSDPHRLFNAGLDAKESRSIDIGESDKIDEPALKELIRAAANANDKKPRATSKK